MRADRENSCQDKQIFKEALNNRSVIYLERVDITASVRMISRCCKQRQTFSLEAATVLYSAVAAAASLANQLNKLSKDGTWSLCYTEEVQRGRERERERKSFAVSYQNKSSWRFRWSRELISPSLSNNAFTLRQIIHLTRPQQQRTFRILVLFLIVLRLAKQKSELKLTQLRVQFFF